MTAYHEQKVNRIRFAFVQQTISLFFLGLTYVSKVKDQDLKLTKQIHEQTFFSSNSHSPAHIHIFLDLNLQKSNFSFNHQATQIQSINTTPKFIKFH